MFIKKIKDNADTGLAWCLAYYKPSMDVRDDEDDDSHND